MGNNGKILIQGDPKLIVRSRLPFCVVELELNISVDYGTFQQQPNMQIRTTYRIKPSILEISFGGVTISSSSLCFQEITPTMSAQVRYYLYLNQEAINFIESKRTDDIDIYLQLTGFYEEVRADNTRQGSGSPNPSGTLQLGGLWSFSQTKWTKFLADIGYGEKWIVEIERPKLEGFSTVFEKVQSANEKLLLGPQSDASDILTDLRASWDRFDPYLNNKLNELKKAINEKSDSEKGRPSKDERIFEIVGAQKNLIESIGNLQKKVDQFLQIGAHREIYLSTYQDALLGFRMTVSLMEYLSKILSQVVINDEATKEGKTR
ncbi:MAG: hypothetical protein KIS29_01575 [Thermoplasmata archaeon]|nr:hypothetical protein [Candidatus Sysuiplasma jiujiangense]